MLSELSKPGLPVAAINNLHSTILHACYWHNHWQQSGYEQSAPRFLADSAMQWLLHNDCATSVYLMWSQD